jgi:hypothetical protein
MPGIKITTLADGRLELSGGTYDRRTEIRALGGRWNPATKTWTLPAGTDVTSLEKPLPPPPPPPPSTAAAAAAAVPPRIRRTGAWRGYSGPCCAAATSFSDADNPYGPIHYRCVHHGVTRNSYTGT